MPTMTELKRPTLISPAASSRPIPFERAAVLVLGAMQSAIADLFKAVPGGVRKQADLEKSFGVDRKLCWQVYRIATASNPLAAGTNVPARVSLDRLLKAASSKRIPAAIIERISSAFDDFDRLVTEHAGDREEFDSLLAAALPEEQEKMLQSSREVMYDAARNIRGVAVEAALYARILCPSRGAPEMLDGCSLIASLGLRRIRRGAHIEHMIRASVNNRSRVTSIDGRPVSGFADVMLEPFCSRPLPSVSARQGGSGGEQTRYVLDADEVGVKAAVDLVIADLVPEWCSRYASKERPVLGAAHGPDMAARWQVLDVLVYDGVAPLQEPEVGVYDMVPYGALSRFPDPDRECDRVAFQPAARYMGTGIEAFRCTHVPRYEEMLAHICAMRDWDSSKFHGYRVEIEYPVYSWQTVLTLKLPPALGAM